MISFVRQFCLCVLVCSVTWPELLAVPVPGHVQIGVDVGPVYRLSSANFPNENDAFGQAKTGYDVVLGLVFEASEKTKPINFRHNHTVFVNRSPQIPQWAANRCMCDIIPCPIPCMSLHPTFTYTVMTA